MRLLLIEDDHKLSKALIRKLSQSYVVEWAATAEDADFKTYVNSYDLIILDLGLPDGSGLDICQKIRSAYHQTTPVLVLTAEFTLEFKLKAFNLGVDDYLTKPFQIEELEARLRSLTKRYSSLPTSTALKLGDLTLDLQTKQVFRQNTQISLRRKEFDLLEYLMRNPGVAITRDKMLEHVWDSAYESVTNIIDVHIKSLRDQVDKNFEYKMVRTVRGIGYMLQCDHN